VDRVQALLSSFHDDGEPRLGRTQVLGLGGLGYHHFRVFVEGRVRVEGDYYVDSSARFSVTSGTSPTAPPAPVQGSPLPPTLGTSLMPDSPGEAHMVVDLPYTP